MTARRRAACVLGLLAAAGCRASEQRPGFAAMPQMYASVSYKPYDPNPATRTGQTLTLPAEGSIALGMEPFGYGPGPEEAARAGRELRNPVPASDDSLRRGKKVFDTVCFVCHGPAGLGDGPIIGRFPNPPSLTAARARQLADGKIFHIITRGQGIMPSHAAQVLPDDRWRVILYVRQLQQAAAPLPAVAPPAAARSTP